MKKKTTQSKGLTLYQAKDCQQCTKNNLCLRGKAKFRYVGRYTREDLLIKMRNRLITKTAKKK